MINAALELLELGLSVVPLQKNKKMPPFGCTWKEQQKQLPSEELIESRFIKYPDSNLGIVTGAVSGIVVVDGDSAEACDWIENNFPHTWLTVSNLGRGRHYYYKYPTVGGVRNNASLLHHAVDVRGTAGLVVVPPSKHKSGNNYQWNIEEGFSLEELADLPEYPAKFCDAAYISAGSQNETGKKDDYVPGELKNIADKCAWMRHCRTDAKKLGYEEWIWMLSIVGRCVDGRKKCHQLSKLGTGYNFEQCDKKITETTMAMGAVTCRTISRKFDGCFDCKVKGKAAKKFSPVILGAEAVIENETQRITIEDIEKEQIDNLTLKLPERIINPGGLISLGMAALRETEAPEIPQYSFPIVVSIIARALMGRVTYAGLWPNFYMVKIGGTSTGKTDCDKIMRRAICNNIDSENFYGQDDFSSGPGLLRGLEGNPQTLINLDEISYLFRRFDKHDPITSGKIEVLLQLFTNCGGIYKKSYGDSKKAIILNQPCLSLTGNATPGIFDDIKSEDFISGLIQRFTFFCYDGKIPYRKIYTGSYGKEMTSFLNGIKRLYVKKDNSEIKTLVDAVDVPVEMTTAQNVSNRIQIFSKKITDLANAETDAGKTGIISRQYNEAMKYAMIYSAGQGYTMTLQAIEYGIALAEILAGWKLNVLSGKVREGQFHRDCEIFKEGIVAAVRMGKRPTGKLIANRRPRIKELKPHEFLNVVTALKARKEIEIDDSGRSTAYFLLK